MTKAYTAIELLREIHAFWESGGAMTGSIGAMLSPYAYITDEDRAICELVAECVARESAQVFHVWMDFGTPGAKEFGVDYPTRYRASTVAKAYASDFPAHHYSARKAGS